MTVTGWQAITWTYDYRGIKETCFGAAHLWLRQGLNQGPTLHVSDLYILNPLNNAPYIMHSQEQFNPVHIIITYSMLPSIFFLPVQSVSEVLTSLMYLVHHCLPNVIAIFHSDSSNLRSLIWQSDCLSPLRPWQNGQYFTEHILKCNIINEKFVFWFIFHWNLLI